MAAEVLSYWDYVKAAFKYKYQLPLLGKMPLNMMVLITFGLLGLFNPGFWFLGAAAELAYLGILSTSSSFQKVVQGERLLARQQGHEAKVQNLASGLSAPSAARYRDLMDRCNEILGIEFTAEQAGVLGNVRGGSLSQLLWLFLRLLSSRELIIWTLKQVDPKALQADLEKLKGRLAMAVEDSPLSKSLRATLDIQSKRLENLSKSKGNLEVIDAELERIEQQVRLLQEESATSGGPQFLSAKLDAVTATLSETSQWMDQHAEFFSSLAGEEMDGASATLPKPPAVSQKE